MTKWVTGLRQAFEEACETVRKAAQVFVDSGYSVRDATKDEGENYKGWEMSEGFANLYVVASSGLGAATDPYQNLYVSFSFTESEKDLPVIVEVLNLLEKTSRVKPRAKSGEKQGKVVYTFFLWRWGKRLSK